MNSFISSRGVSAASGAEASGYLARPAAFEGRKSPKERNPREDSCGRERRWFRRQCPTRVRFETAETSYRLWPDKSTEEQSPQKGSPRLARRPHALRIKTKRDLARPKSESALRGDCSRSCRRYSWLMGAGASVTSRRYSPRPSNVPASPIAISTVANPECPINVDTGPSRGNYVSDFDRQGASPLQALGRWSLALLPLGHGP